MIVYFVDNSIHQIPNFIYIALEAGGTVLTDGVDSYRVIGEHYPSVKVELLPNAQEAAARAKDLNAQAIVQPDFTGRFFRETGIKQVQVFHGLSDKKYNFSKSLPEYALTLLPGARMEDQFRQAGMLGKFNYEVVGYSKCDRVFLGELYKREYRKQFGLDPDKTTVLYAPTWNDHSGNTSIPKFGLEVLSQIPDNIQLVVKLHPNTRRKDKKYYPAMQEIAGRKDNVTFIDFAHDVIPVMATADLMIGDISSVTYEFIPFQRPLAFLDSGFHLFAKKARTWIWQAGDVVTKKGQVWPTVIKRLAHPQGYAAKREEIMNYIFYKPDGNAAKRSAEAIAKIID